MRTVDRGARRAQLIAGGQHADAQAAVDLDPGQPQNGHQRQILRLHYTALRQCSVTLGHVFAGEGYDTPTDLRYCINSISLTLEEKPIEG